MKKILFLSVSTISLIMVSPAVAKESSLPSREEMWKMIQVQQKQIDALQSHIQQQDQKIVQTEAKVEETVEKIEKTAEKIEETVAVVEQTQETVASIDPALIEPAAGNGWWDRTSIGGYGELHYNGGNVDEVDFHRFVLNFNHNFNDDIRLLSELEVEHSVTGDGQPGEVVLEQALLEFDLTKDDAHKAQAGVFLVPLGILNEVHEPPTFFGVERNIVETQIIPSTFSEAGVQLLGNLGESGFSYNAAAHSSLSVDPADFDIRGGRNKVAEAEATDPAFTGRVRWSGYPGVTLGIGGQYQADITQDANDNEQVGATLIETHADIRRGGWGLRALYARWDIDSDAAEALGADEQIGWYIEPSYRFEVPFGYDDGYGELGVFARYNEVDENNGSDAVDGKTEQWDVGLNYWPIPNVVLKADYNFINGEGQGNDDSRLNLGVGYQF